MNWQDLWRGRSHYTFFDSHFGDGTRFRALLQAWQNDTQRPARLQYIALDHAGMPGFRRIPQAQAGVTLDLLHASLDSALAQLDARLDGICLHDMSGQGSGFARALARLAQPGAVLHAHGLSETQLHALGANGFPCTAGEDGWSRANFTSRKPPSPWARKPEPVREAIVIGAGLAGAAACERLCARGWQVTLVEQHADVASEASGNLAGVFMPLLSKDDNLMTRLARAAYLYALDYWASLGGIGPGAAIKGAQCGVLQLARDSANAQVQQAIAAKHAYPNAFAQWLDSAAATALSGVSAPDGAWLFPQGGWARPSSVCAALLAACGPALVRRLGVGRVRLVRDGAVWQVLKIDGELVASAPVVVVANGTGAIELAQTAALPLTALRGQVTDMEAGALPPLQHVLCREAYVTPAIDGVHSLGASYDTDSEPGLRATSQQENYEKIGSLLALPGVGDGAPLAGRVGFRCVAPDRLPLVGALPVSEISGRPERLRELERQPGLYGLLGYASRGLIWSPLCAELLAAQLDGEALPLEAELATALDPARFLLRARRR
jgi:tRNA 5-methylaminomethyl-2-thiouridine biosynthesis bifunctional protein